MWFPTSYRGPTPESTKVERRNYPQRRLVNSLSVVSSKRVMVAFGATFIFLVHHIQFLSFFSNNEDRGPSLAAISTTISLRNSTLLFSTSPEPRKIVFVHLGKTAGSTLTCRFSRKVQAPTEQNGGFDARAACLQEPEDTAITRQVIDRYHLYETPVDDKRYDSFLITLRNPVDRIISWYYYMHPKLPPTKKPHHRQQCQNFDFFKCWPTLDVLVSKGLVTRGTTSNLSPAEERCSKLAWDGLSGSSYCFHNYWNYNRTYGCLLERKSGDIFAIRTEHTLHDWNSVDTLLGGSGNTTTITNYNYFAKKDKMKNQVTPEHKKTLCLALCSEIQIYKKLLNAATNLSPDDRNESLQELMKTCPNEEARVVTCAPHTF